MSARTPDSPDRQPDVRPPSVEAVLSLVRPRLDLGADPSAVSAVVRDVIATERSALLDGAVARSSEALADDVTEWLGAMVGPRGSGLVPVINATGVIVHTNLGRAAWPQAAVDAAVSAASGSVLLELDRGTGKRGRRYRVAEQHLIALTGAEDALITNNNAAALALSVGLVHRRGILVSRGELLEIGGGVRIPEVIRRAGAKLIEVGTTNRTRASDYEGPLAEGRAAMILRVHRSNFRQQGFVESPDDAALADLAREAGVPLVDDLGSGALIDSAAFGLSHEPTPRERLEAGADIVTFSGDKLLGGPQAGLIAGRAELIERIRRDPLARAMRPDKATLAGVAATLAIYRAGRAALDIPVWRSIAATVDGLRERAEAVLAAVIAGDGRQDASAKAVTIVESQATVGGGALPGETLPSVALRIRGVPSSRLVAALRGGDPCVIARVERGAVMVDLRTVDPGQDGDLATALTSALEDATDRRAP